MEFPGPEPRCQSRRWKSAEQKFLWLLYGRWLFRDIMAKISPQLILWESIMYDRLAVRLRPPRIIEHRRDVSNIDRKMRKKKSCSTLFSANAVAFEWKNWLQRLRWEPLPRFRTQWSQLCYQGFVLALCGCLSLKLEIWNSLAVLLAVPTSPAAELPLPTNLFTSARRDVRIGLWFTCQVL